MHVCGGPAAPRPHVVSRRRPLPVCLVEDVTEEAAARLRATTRVPSVAVRSQRRSGAAARNGRGDGGATCWATGAPEATAAVRRLVYSTEDDRQRGERHATYFPP